MKKLNEEEKKILAFIPNGIQFAVPLKDLTRLMNRDDRYVRNLISHLITVHHVAIGAHYGHPHGYYLITNESDRDIALKPLISQTRELTRRIDSISEADLDGNKKAVNAD